MSRYLEMSEKAAIWSKRQIDEVRDSADFARQVAVRYSTYLQAPPGNVTYTTLTRDLTFAGKYPPLEEAPTLLTNAKTGMHYFGLAVHFTNGVHGSIDRFVLGVRHGAAGWDVDLLDDQSFSIPADDLDKLEAVFKRQLEMSAGAYESNSVKIAPIGFVYLTTN